MNLHWGTEIASLLKAKRRLLSETQAEIKRLEQFSSDGQRVMSACPTPEADGSCPGHEEEA